MTQTTVNRQLSLLVRGVLQSNEVDNLKLEIDLVSSLHRMWFEGGKDPAKLASVREDVISSLLESASGENELVAMEGRVSKSLGISIDGRSRYDDMLKFLVRKDKEGQAVEKYAQWCKDNPFEAPKAFQIANRPALLVETWNMAFMEEPKPDIEYPKVVADEEEAKFVPPPNARPKNLPPPRPRTRPTSV